MPRLIYAQSEQDADLLYASQFLAPDPFLYFEKGSRSFLVLNPLEYDRGVKTAKVDRVINLSDIIKKLKKHSSTPIKTADWIHFVLREHRIQHIEVASHFPFELGIELKNKGIRISIAKNGLYPEREQKKKDEVRHIQHALKITSLLLERAIDLIRQSHIKHHNTLFLGNSVLTSEHIHSEIRMLAARHHFEAPHPIVAGGHQACDPHERGHGPLHANELMILDIFPKSLTSGYWGDMTRTVIKGRPSEAQKKLFHTVYKAQKLALSKLRKGVNGLKVHQTVENYFIQQGYQTGNSNGRYEGFFHGTGHGLGLEIHEAPRLSKISDILKTGHVVTVEPGLYYPEIGGVRIEDVALITATGSQKLSCYPYTLSLI